MIGEAGALPRATQAITVTFSLSNDQLKAVFEGEGPLNGLILEHGTPPAA